MPDRRSVCPVPSQLEAYRSSEIDAEEARLVAKHVESCADCRTDLKELSLDEGFIGNLRAHIPSRPSASSASLRSAQEPDPDHEALVAHLRASGEGERYEVLGELGRGGMGVIYEVRDRVLQRDLAMKVARLDSKRSASGASPAGRRLARFLDEARITGQLDHPSIIPVHELGIDGEGRAFFTMSKVRGRDLHDVLAEFERGEGDWTLRGLISIVLRACEALAYAHTKQFVHRDLKPANIMVGSFGEVYVIDWGVAKKLGERDPGGPAAPSRSEESQRSGEVQTSSLTLDGEVLGTPAYMAPEQALGNADRVDLRADVYSMGAILYRLLSRHRPYGEGGKKGTPREAWNRLLVGSPANLSEVAPEALPELVAISRRAMDRNPNERYPSMELLAGDLRAWLDGRVVSAYRTGVAAEARKWIGRNRALAGLAVVAGLVVLGMTWSQTIVAASARAVLEHSVKNLGANRLSKRDPTEALRLAVEVAETEENFLSRTTLLAALIPHAREAELLSGRSLGNLSNWLPESVHRAWSPDGNYFVFGAGEEDGFQAVRVWDVKARELTEDSIPASFSPHLVFDPTGSLIARAGQEGSLSIYDRVTRNSREFTKEGRRAEVGEIVRLVFSPSGDLLASACMEGIIDLWNVADGKHVRRFVGHEGIVIPIEFGPSGKRLLSGSGDPLTGYESDHTVRVWDVDSGACLLVFDEHSAPLTAVRFSPCGDLALSTSKDGTARLWDTRTGAVKRTMSFPGSALDGAFSPDGSGLAVAYDSGLMVQEVESGHEHRLGPNHAHTGRAVSDVDFSPQGDRLLSIGYDGAGRVWSLAGVGPPTLEFALRDSEPKRSFGSWSPNGSMIALHGGYGTSLWFTRGNRVTSWVRPADDPVTSARFHPAGDRILLIFENRPAHEFAFEPGKRLELLGTLGGAHAADVAVTADGVWTLVAEEGGPVRLWRRVEGEASRELGRIELDAASLHPSKVDAILGAILTGGGAATMDLSQSPARVVRFAENETVTAIDISADGRRVLLGTEDCKVHIFDRESGERIASEPLEEHTPTQRAVHSVFFYDEGRRFLSSGPKPGLRLWEVEANVLTGVDRPVGGITIGPAVVLKNGKPLLRAQWNPLLLMSDDDVLSKTFPLVQPGEHLAHYGLITSWSFDSSERRMLTTSLDHTATIWDLERAEPWVSFAGHKYCVTAGDLARDGHWAVTGDAEGYVFVWPTDPLPWAERALPVEAQSSPR